MRLLLLLLSFVSLFSFALAAAVQQPAVLLTEQDELELKFIPEAELVDAPNVARFSCPSMKVRCVKDGKWPAGIVGDIGKKEFCQVGWRCNQCAEEENTAECNQAFDSCEGACQAFAPIPF